MRKKLSLWLSLGVLLTFSACGGDDEKPQNTSEEGGSGGKSGSGGRAAAGSGGSGKGTGSGDEGSECKSDADCSSDLSCLKADANIADLKVCARHCGGASDCKDGESCLSIADKTPEQAMCWKTVTEALKPCGPAFTAICDDKTKNLGCLRVESDSGSVAGGVCLQPCKLKEKDSCSDGFTCLDLIDMADMGLCVHTVKRGDSCDEPNGQFCEDGNLCLGDSGDWRCYQDCSDSKKCDDDKECKALGGSGDGSYCE